mgnify:CR=1 FL=1
MREEGAPPTASGTPDGFRRGGENGAGKGEGHRCEENGVPRQRKRNRDGAKGRFSARGQRGAGIRAAGR